MQKILSLLFIITFSTNVFAQNTFKTIIKDGKTNKPLSGVVVLLKGTQNSVTSDDKGLAKLKNISNGKQTILIKSLGYTENEKNIVFHQSDTITLFLEPLSEELEEVKIVSSTRSSRNIKDIPTRIEGIPLADLEEKSVMQPGNIKMLVSEIVGVQTQQTSQVSGSASIRIQGLDGKYTQLLQDGFPLYSGFASGLSVLQIPPLNLKRVEVIKGSTSTLYGGGAIAGLINLITKEPTAKREISFLANTNQTNALDLSGFYAERYKKTGITIYTSGNFQKAYDNNNDSFSDIPKYSRYSINPNFFYYLDDRTTFSFGVNAGFEIRTGGDLQVINNDAHTIHSYFETNNANRYASLAKFEKTFSNKNRLTIKNSIGYFNRTIERSAYLFEGQQLATFSEANYLIPKEKSEWNLGANLVSENFRQINIVTDKLDYYSAAFGIFAQNNLRVSEKFIVESGLRFDITNRKNLFVLPRLSLLYKITDQLTSRIGGGLGYKTPTIFSEEAEEKAFQNINPLDFTKVSPERSYGLNADLNYKKILFGDINFSFNQLFFYTSIKNPLVLNPVADRSDFSFENANGYLESKGFESTIKLRLDNISCFLGYTYTDVNRNYNHVSSVNPLTAKHHLNLDAMYEWNEKLRLGYELYYVGEQYLTNNEKVRDYWVTGISGEYKFKHFSLFLNLENFLDTRQSKWESLYSGTIQNPEFREIYTPTEGFILNGGCKIWL
ncbi:TonB-dependent receptor [Flavobacterium soyangense]|uniref:TonB-dependent receptor plug domain-containing protein n=1 Tax=Flavobacterium soyangense TaxID=2023265 RepID=A0A930XVN0_9FLAO|nr:TonB-dependent receptor [Flavobacterium soyangense]MBF2708481.1 TonB-dependent receptor plug domain-containing protein [Flavobacterium soyangense]